MCVLYPRLSDVNAPVLRRLRRGPTTTGGTLTSIRIRSVLDATDPDLMAFRDRGGKLMMYFGWADSGPNPRIGTRYYKAVLDSLGYFRDTCKLST
jgi:hypothetical protein